MVTPWVLVATSEGLVAGDCDDGLVPGLVERDGSRELGAIGAVLVEEAEVVDPGDVEAPVVVLERAAEGSLVGLSDGVVIEAVEDEELLEPVVTFPFTVVGVSEVVEVDSAVVGVTESLEVVDPEVTLVEVGLELRAPVSLLGAALTSSASHLARGAAW